MTEHKGLAHPGRRRNAAVGVIIGSLCGLVLCGFALFGIHAGQKILAQQAALDSHGSRASGKVIRTEASGTKTRTYSIGYTFDAEGWPYWHDSLVSKHDYLQASVGDNVIVTYLPGHPEISRITQSIDKEDAQFEIRAGYILLFGVCILSVLSVVSGLKSKLRRPPVESPPP